MAPERILYEGGVWALIMSWFAILSGRQDKLRKEVILREEFNEHKIDDREEHKEIKDDVKYIRKRIDEHFSK